VSHHYPITVCSEPKTPHWGNLLPLLESLFPVRFRASQQRAVEGAGELLIDQAEDYVRGDHAGCIPSLSVPRSDSSDKSELFDIAVRFADNQLTPFPFRGKSLRAKVASHPKILSLSSSEQALAFTEHGPVWSVSAEDDVKHFKSGFALPSIAPHGDLKAVLNEEHFFEILPLLHWLREISADTVFEGPPSGACFIFDDPNLHWKRYGFVDFRQIATHAERENYHVSFATIPLDSWFTHRATAEIFRRNAKRVSLAIHGNNHTKCELARSYTPSERASLLGQAIRRIEHFESSAGLQVARVMVPPHGACSEEMLAELPKFGFESACVSHGSLRAHNKTKQWTKTLGYLSSELVEGCPVLPRWGFAGNTTNAILLAAFLKQRIILRGHHQDLRDGIELLDQHARLINSLGIVSWSNLTTLSRTNYYWRLEGTTCTLKAMGERVTFQMPEHASRLIIESPHNDHRLTWRITGVNGASLMARSGEEVLPPVTRNNEFSIQAVPPSSVCVSGISTRLQGKAIVRRLLAEARDRVLR
jgi:hypothetical protein